MYLGRVGQSLLPSPRCTSSRCNHGKELSSAASNGSSNIVPVLSPLLPPLTHLTWRSPQSPSLSTVSRQCAAKDRRQDSPLVLLCARRHGQAIIRPRPPSPRHRQHHQSDDQFVKGEGGTVGTSMDGFLQMGPSAYGAFPVSRLVSIA